MKKWIKNILSYTLIWSMVFGIIPWQNISYAATIPTVTITKNFEETALSPKDGIVSISDTRLSTIIKKKVALILMDGELKQIDQNLVTDLGDRVQFSIQSDVKISGIRVYLESDPSKYLEYDGISENEMVAVSSVVSYQADGKGPIILNGTDLGKFVSNTGLSVYVGNKQSKAEKGTSDNEAKLTPENANDSFDPGLQDILFKLNKTGLSVVNKTGSGVDEKYNLNINNQYLKAVSVVGNLSLDGIEVLPPIGQTGDEISFIRAGLDAYDVYFVQDVSNKNLFNIAHKATFVSLGENSDKKSVLKVKLPKLPEGPGQYRVVLTNKDSLNKGIFARYIVPEEFTYIEASKTPKINKGINPLQAPQLIPTHVSIPVEYVQNLELQGYSWTLTDGATYKIIPDSNNGLPNGMIDINYGEHDINIGKYKGKATVTRQIRVYIGGQTDFIIGRDAKGEDINKFPTSIIETLHVNTPVINDSQLEHKVKIAIDTTIQMTGGDTIKLPTKNIFSEELFKYIPSTEVPQIKNVIPNIIPLEKQGGKYYISSKIKSHGDGTEKPELEINIVGDKFLVTKINKVTRYPKVKLGDIEIDPKKDDKTGKYVDEKILDFKVFKDNQEVTGDGSNEVGNKIMIKIKVGQDGYEIPSSNLGVRPVSISNPLRNNPDEYNPYIIFNEQIEFKEIQEEDVPIITQVIPTVIGADSQEPVQIIGSNFQEGAKVFIDGEEVKNVKISPNNDKIDFNAPIGREDSTVQIIVQNPRGGIATWPITYTKTYTNPEFKELSPDRGSANTSVVVKGNNFKGQDPTLDPNDLNLSEQQIYRLIGTRIFMDNKDINRYYTENGKIKLTEFTENKGLTLKENIISLSQDELHPLSLGRDFKSSILYDETNKKFYSITYDNSTNRVKMYDGYGKNYYFRLKDGKVVAEEFGNLNPNQSDNKPNELYDVEQGTKGILELKGKKNITLKAYTPFYIEKVTEEGKTYDRVTGNRVFFKNSSEMTFYVPFLGPNSKDCVVEVVNPDTKRAKNKGNFEYIGNPKIIPQVISFDPSSGSSKGGTTVVFKGPDDTDYKTSFLNDGKEKTRVWIGEKEVKAEDVIVSADGKTLTIKTPSYEDVVGYETKNITLINPDGGAFKITPEFPLDNLSGFTYIQTSNDPEITEVKPKEGSAAGGYEIEIWGKNFKDEEPFDDKNGNGRKDSDEPPTINIVGTLEDWYGSFYIDGSNGKPKNGVYDIGETIVGGGIKKSTYNPNVDYIDSPLLPKVYFGSTQGHITEFKPGFDGYMKVIVPPGKENVDLTIINNDGGISKPYKFKYITKNPVIKNISPNTGRRQGGDLIEITGNGFDKKVKIRFGSLTNKDLPREDQNSGVIRAQKAIVKFPTPKVGEVAVDYLTIEYDVTAKKLQIQLKDNGKVYEKIYYDYNGEEKFINTTDLYAQNDKYNKEQLIRIEENESNDKELTGRLIVEAGYAPKVQWENEGKIIVTSPSYFHSGQAPVVVINPDGGEAEGSFDYTNPLSDPKITNITKNGQPPVLKNLEGKEAKLLQMSYKGGNQITIFGSDFKEGVSIEIGDLFKIDSKDITAELPAKLTFKMPATGEENVGKLFRVVVKNQDGGVASSDELTPPIYIQFTKGESKVSIDSIQPNIGSTKGGDKVILKGSGFRETMDGYPGKKISIYFGDVKVPDEYVVYRSDKELQILATPSNKPGKVQVRVENPDGEPSDPTGEYTYLSAPIIYDVALTDKDDLTKEESIDVISVEGGQYIKVKGSGFIQGSKVVFAPKLKDAPKDDLGNVVYLKGDPKNKKIVEGIDGSEVKFIDEGTLLVKTPAGKLEDIGIIVINPDKGASDLYEGIKYGLPELSKPTGVVAELVYDQYIKVTWNEVKDAQEYEIYVVVDGHKKEFVGSTELNHFVYEDLEPKTRYKFVVTAIGKFGGSKYSMESNEVKTGSSVGPRDKDGELGEKTKIERNGNIVNVIIGEDDYDKNLDIDLTRGNFAGSKEVIISIPSYVAAKYDSKDINIIGQDFNIKMNPKSFYSEKVRENKNKRDSGVSFSICPTQSMSMVSGKTQLSKEYELKAFVYVGREKTPMNYLPSYVQITLDVDRTKADLRRVKNIYLAYYDEETRQWLPISTGNEGSYAITGLSQNLGRFSIMGSRR